VGAGGLRVHYRPIERPDGELRGVEAVVRWQRPGYGLVAPDDLMALAEDTGVARLVGEWLLRAAVLEVADWEREGLVGDDFVLALEVSPRQLSDPAFPAAAAAALRDWPLPPANLRLVVGRDSADPDVLRRLEEVGVGLALDPDTQPAAPLEGARLRTEVLAQRRASATITPNSSAR
jgi:diguanylate cyclase